MVRVVGVVRVVAGQGGQDGKSGQGGQVVGVVGIVRVDRVIGVMVMKVVCCAHFLVDLHWFRFLLRKEGRMGKLKVLYGILTDQKRQK